MQSPLLLRLRSCLACLATAALLAGGGAFAAEPANRTPKYYYDHAVELIAAGDLQGAVLELRNALEGNPKDLASRVLLGRIHVDLENGAAAAAELSRARREGAPGSFVLVPLGRAYMLQGEYRRVLTEIGPDGQDQGTAAAISLIRGDAHLALGERREAEASYRAAAGIRPNDAKPLIGLARVKLSADDVGGAGIYARRAVETNENDPAAWLIQGEVAALRGEPDEALASYDRAIALAPEFPPAMLARAAVRIERGEHDRAEPDIRTVRKSRPHDPQAVYLLTLILSRHGRVDEARALLAEAERTLVGTDPAGLLLAAAAAHLQDDPETCRQLLGRFLEHAPRHRNARKLLAASALMRNAPEEAIRRLEGLAPQQPADIEVLGMFGDALIRLGRYAEAATVLERAASASHGPSDLFRLLALRPGAGRTAEAMQLMSTAMARHPDAVRVATLLGAVQLRMGDFTAALETLEPVTKRDPANALAHNLAGGAHLALGDLKAAWASYRTAIAVVPDYLPAIENLAKLEARLGNPDAAVALFSTVLEKRPDMPEIRYHLAVALNTLGRIDEAVAQLRAALAASRPFDATADARALLAKLAPPGEKRER